MWMDVLFIFILFIRIGLSKLWAIQADTTMSSVHLRSLFLDNSQPANNRDLTNKLSEIHTHIQYECGGWQWLTG